MTDWPEYVDCPRAVAILETYLANYDKRWPRCGDASDYERDILKPAALLERECNALRLRLESCEREALTKAAAVCEAKAVECNQRGQGLANIMAAAAARVCRDSILALLKPAAAEGHCSHCGKWIDEPCPYSPCPIKAKGAKP